MKGYCDDCGIVDPHCICNEPQFYVTKTRKINKQFAGVRTVRNSSVELSDNIKVAFSILSLNDKRAYAKRLHDLGWTYQNIGNVNNLSRERIRQWILEHDKHIFDYAKVYSLPAYPKPLKEIKLFKHVPLIPDAETIAKLKDLHDKATLVRSSSPRYRMEAELFTSMLNDLLNDGYTRYQIAKALDLTHGALHHRLVRYGYKKSTGKSKALTHVTQNRWRNDG